MVALLTVADHDSGAQGIVDCSIQSDAFELSSLDVHEYKVIVVKPLDREAEPQHNVTVVCRDMGSPRLQDSVNFVIDVSILYIHVCIFVSPYHNVYTILSYHESFFSTS